MRKAILALIAAMGIIGSTPLYADTIATNDACKVALVAYMNGYLQISMTGATALTLTSGEVAFRSSGDDDDAWSETVSLNSSKLGPGGTDQKKGVYFSCKKHFESNVDVKFRVSDGTNYSDWMIREDVRVERFPLPVAAYSQVAGYAYPGGLKCLANGKQDGIGEYFSANSEYLQLDYGASSYISGIRVIPRLAFPERLQLAEVLVSENADMSDAVTVIARTPNWDSSTTTAADWVFPETVKGRYVRITAKSVTSGTFCVNFCELEAYSDRANVVDFQMDIKQDSHDSPYPSFSIVMPARVINSYVIERAFTADGPWYVVANPDNDVVDVIETTPSTVGACYFYRARFQLTAEDGTPYEVTTNPKTYYFPRCIERDWATAPGTLFDCVSVLEDCQREERSDGEMSNAYDGLSSTVIYTTANPLIGLDFGSPFHLTQAWVLSRASGYGINTPISFWGANEMPTNTVEAQTSDDPAHTELYRNTEDGGGWSNYFSYWYAFPVADPSAASYRYGFIHKNATDAAASNWGNVSEVTFWGYSENDELEAQFIAPEIVKATRLADDILITWSPGNNVTGYILERKIGDDGEWTQIGSFGTDVFSFKDTDKKEVGENYTYRIKVTNDDETEYSAELPVFFYTLGDGTGLLATYSAPAPQKSYDPEVAVLGSETTEGINVEITGSTPLYGNVFGDLLVAWKGTLIVPISGEYYFSADATDGFMLEIDGDLYFNGNKDLYKGNVDVSVCSVLNDWATTDGVVTTRTSKGITLEAGEHQIRAWWNPAAGPKKCILKWLPPSAKAYETIPVTQLKPAASSDTETYGDEGWRFGTVSNKRGYISQIAGDTFAIGEADVAPISTFFHGSFAWKKISSRAFTLEAEVFAPQMFRQYGGIFISANLNGGMRGDGASLFFFRFARSKKLNIRRRAKAGESDEYLIPGHYNIASQNTDHAYDGMELAWLRIERSGSTFIFKALRGSSIRGILLGEWTEIARYEDTEGAFGKDVYVGFGSSTEAMDSLVYQARYLFRNVKVNTKGPMILFVK